MVGGKRMSSPTHNGSVCPDDLEYYAPRRPHAETVSALAEHLSSPSSLAANDWSAAAQDNEVIVPFPQARDYLNGLEHRTRRTWRTKALVLSGAAAVALTGGIALFGYSKATRPVHEAHPQEPVISLAARLQTAAVDIQKASQQAVTPTLTVTNSEGDMNAALALGLGVKNYTPGAVVALSGLPPGVSISKGIAEPDGRWRIAVDELPGAKVTPPSGYAGAMTITAELRTRNDLPIVRSPVRLTWHSRPVSAPASAASPVSAQTASRAKATMSDPPIRRLDPKEAASLLRRAEDLKAAGDIAAARLLLQRVAETNNAQAAFDLAETYDPIAMKKFRASSVAPDPALAQYWYQRARDSETS